MIRDVIDNQVGLYKEVKSSIRKKRIVHLVESAMRVLKKNTPVSISVAIVSGKTGRALNNQYRAVDSVPSVLSFEEVGISKNGSFISPKQTLKYIGEIVISDPVVRKRAKENSTSYYSEFDYLFIHGFLHLMGYTHEKERQADKMERQEKNILKLLNQR